MKITCSKCGKRFNAEQHMYICPKCNHYHSQVGSGSSLNIDEKPVKKYRWETDPIELEDEESDFFSDVSSVGKKIALAICIIAGFIIFIGSTIIDSGGWSDDPNSWDSGWGSSYTEEIEVEYGDSMDFETFTVNVIEVGEPEVKGLKADKGCKLVQVNFETESPYEYESEDISTDIQLIAHYNEEPPYIAGEYYALYEGELNTDSSTERELRDEGLVIAAHYSGKYFCIFEIPEEVEDVDLKITSFVPEEDDSWSYVQDECFRMPLEL